MQSAASANVSADATAMNTERQPLLGQSAGPALSEPPTRWNVSADTALVNVQSDDDGMCTGLWR